MIPKKLLVVLPGWLTDKTLRRKLERAGYIIVETENLEAIRVMDPMMVPSDEMMQQLAAIVWDSISGPEKFGKYVLRKMLPASTLAAPRTKP